MSTSAYAAAKGPAFDPNRDRHTSFNLGWALLTTIAAAATVALSYGTWYKQVVVVNSGPTVSLVLISPFKLLSHEYTGWRLLVPISAGAVGVCALLSGMIWRRGLQPRLFAWFLRLLGLGAVAAVVAALIVRNPHPLPPVVPAKGYVIVSVLYQLGGAGWVTLIAAVVTFVLTIPRGTRIR